MGRITIAIHGGAGTIVKSEMNDGLHAQYSAALQQVLDAAYRVLEGGGSAVEAVRLATEWLENDVLFNAGRGSVFTKDGSQEMDAAIMDGRDCSAGAVAAVRNIRNPVHL